MSYGGRRGMLGLVAAMEDAALAVVMVQFGTNDCLCPTSSLVELCRGEHAERRGDAGCQSIALNTQAAIMNVPRPAASMRYSGQ